MAYITSTLFLWSLRPKYVEGQTGCHILIQFIMGKLLTHPQIKLHVAMALLESKIKIKWIWYSNSDGMRHKKSQIYWDMSPF
jgi:hypothetical protein